MGDEATKEFQADRLPPDTVIASITSDACSVRMTVWFAGNRDRCRTLRQYALDTMIQLLHCCARRLLIKGKVVGGAVFGIILVIAVIVLCFIDGQAIVDIFVILALLVSMSAFALLGYAALQVVGLVKEVRGEVKTLVGTAQQTMSEVQGTARFVNKSVVAPVAQASAFVSATRATVKSLTQPLYKRRG